MRSGYLIVAIMLFSGCNFEPRYYADCYQGNSRTRVFSAHHLKSARFEDDKLIVIDSGNRKHVARIGDRTTCYIKQY